MEALYSTFAPYRLRPHVEGCPCCVTDEHQKQIHSKSLRELQPKQLEDFGFKVMSTWGSVEDFKHFLPRLFEIQTFGPDWLTDSEVLFGKLDYGHWLTWPVAEQSAIENFLHTYWAFSLTKESWIDNVEIWLCSIAQCVTDLSAYLRYWLDNLDKSATWHLADLVYGNNYSVAAKSKLGNAFWDTRDEQMKQVISWLQNPATAKAFQEAVVKNNFVHNNSPEVQSALMFFSTSAAGGEWAA